eukprot:COSAG01_NODE_18705_length_1058_cov_11.773723_1_plen_30_part_01
MECLISTDFNESDTGTKCQVNLLANIIIPC